MRRLVASLAILFILASAAAAQQQGKLVEEFWDAAYLNGLKAGYFHTTVHEFERGGQKYLRTAIEQNLTFKRYKSVVNMRMETGTEETPGGKVSSVFLRQSADKGQELHLTGTVEGDQLHVKDDAGAIDKKIAWNKDVIGLHRQYRLCRERKVKPGDRFSYFTYEMSIQAAVQIITTVKNEEEIDMPDLGRGPQTSPAHKTLARRGGTGQDRTRRQFHPAAVGASLARQGPDAGLHAAGNAGCRQSFPVSNFTGNRHCRGRCRREGSGSWADNADPSQSPHRPRPRNPQRGLSHHPEGRRQTGHGICSG